MASSGPFGHRLLFADATATLSTAAVDSRKHNRELPAGIAYTVSFHDPLPEIERAARGDSADGAGGGADGIASDFG